MNSVAKKIMTAAALLALAAVVIAGLTWGSRAWAADTAGPSGAKAEPAAAASGGEVDISDVQSQYWRAHDKDFEVVQNKQYTKAGRIELTPEFGVYQRVDFQDTKTLGLAAAYHLTDLWGLELNGYRMYTSDSYVLSQFQQQTGATVDFNAEHYYMGAAVLFAPIYGKFSLLSKKISHFELYVSPGMGAVKTVNLHFAPSIAIGQKFWISSNWNFRIEYRIMRYSDSVNASTGSFATKNGGPGSFTETVTDQNLVFGISYLFN